MIGSAVVYALFGAMMMTPPAASSDAPRRMFGVRGEEFVLDGAPFLIRSGEMHFARIPRPYWRDRLKKLKAMGLNTVCTYVFWNAHEPEPGRFDFSDNLDVAAFIRVAHEEGLWVIVRPGPYGCAEWEWGGYPWWLANIPGLKVRSTDPRFLDACRRYLTRLGREITPLQITHGGPIIMVQVENEYGSFGNDKQYLGSIRDMIRGAGIDVTLYTSDGPSESMLAGGTLPDVLSVVNFGSDPESQFKQFARFRSGVPRMCGEFYPGWFDHWGAPHARTTTLDKVRDLDWMESHGISYNIYMFHGGTTFGFMNGANGDKGYRPQVTSYDYSTTLDEAGRPTDKFNAFREIIRRHLPSGESLAPIPEPLPLQELPRFELNESISMFDLPGEPVHAEHPSTFESLGQAYGFVLYRTRLNDAARGTLEILDVRDRAQIFADRKAIGILERRLNQTGIDVDLPAGTTLDILVENLGRINYGREMVNESKGITRMVRMAGRELTGWDMYRLPLCDLTGLKFSQARVHAPALHRGRLTLSQPADTFLDMRRWGKGCVWVNGHNLGRFWRIGPQQTLFCPGCWLKSGENEFVVLDVDQHDHRWIQGLNDAINELPPMDSPEPPPARPSHEQLAWQDCEIGMFIHFAPNTWTDREYDDLTLPLSRFDPSKLDTDQWVEAAEAMGAKYIVIVAKHAGGFCLWQTNATEYGVRNTPWRGGKGDVLADLAASCRKRGLRLGVYLSPCDRKHIAGGGGKCDTKEAQQKYNQLYRDQLTEVLSRYGEMYEVWFDGSIVVPVGDILERYAPRAMIFQGPHATIRWVGNEDGFAPDPNWNAVAQSDARTGEATAEHGTRDGRVWLPNECDARMRDTWFWNTGNAGKLKTVEQLMEIYYRSVGHGAQLLLNQTPDTTGRIPDADVRRGAEFAAEVQRRLGKSIAQTSGRGRVFELTFDRPTTIDHVVLMEDLSQGQRVSEYVIESETNGQIGRFAQGTTIGHKKIDRFPPCAVTKVRLRIMVSAGEPVIRRFSVHDAQQPIAPKQ